MSQDTVLGLHTPRRRKIPENPNSVEKPDRLRAILRGVYLYPAALGNIVIGNFHSRSLYARILKSPMMVLGAMIVASVLMLGGSVSQAETPEEVLDQILKKIKAESNASPVVDYVNWDKAFGKFPEDKRQMMHITSPEEMKAYYREVLISPVALMRRQFQSRLSSLPEDQRPILENSFKRMEEAMAEKTEMMKSKIAGTEYFVGKAAIEGDLAKVNLTQTYNGQTRTEEVVFEKTGDRWLLPVVSMLGGGGSTKKTTVKATPPMPAPETMGKAPPPMPPPPAATP